GFLTCWATRCGHMMLHVAGMSFLGLGVSAPTADGGDDQRRPAVYLDPAAANGLAGAGAVHQRDGFLTCWATRCGHMMLHVAGMSFLGLGVSAPTA
ncbi:hypothetical protein, partial [Enterobacter hormaechei]|uniref:hypothetical protein n=1 Tax=Enterobacter hormaechei TaxID=158836 RepID=UPI001F0B5596